MKPKSTEEKAKIPKLKCSLLQDYARSRVSVDEDEDEELLVPEQRLNLLMASPSIIKRRPSMMPITPSKPSSSKPWQSPSNVSRRNETVVESSDNSEYDEEELPLLAIPKLLLRRASTQLGFAFGRDEESKDEPERLSPQPPLSCGDSIIEEAEEDMEDEDKIRRV